MGIDIITQMQKLAQARLVADETSVELEQAQTEFHAADLEHVAYQVENRLEEAV